MSISQILAIRAGLEHILVRRGGQKKNRIERRFIQMPLNNYDEVRRAYISAINAGDVKAVAELFTDDCVVMPPEQPVHAG